MEILKNSAFSAVKSTDLFRLESYDYFLPQDRIAQYPVSPRDHSRLLMISRISAELSDLHFYDLPSLLQPGDLLVLNNTRVLPVRLQSDKGEVLLVKELEDNCWEAMVYPGKHFKPGTAVHFDSGLTAHVVSTSSIGRILRFGGNVNELIERQGKMPLPPYIHRDAEASDRRTYQTIYATKNGSIAAPTAGLHFTRSVFRRLKERGIHVARITLHVGPGTFRPVKSEDITQHEIYPEFYECRKQTWEQIRKAKRVIAVGTTTTRAIETIAATGRLKGSTDLFIYPGYHFHITGGLITNFHLPKSSLLMLVSAFAAYDLMRKAYEHAVKESYRFYSYGDAMLIL
jgi:S-adenosylmethionine:tRNA ribosyltransferase-isomerase